MSIDTGGRGRGRFGPMLSAADPHPGGLFVLLIVLAWPAYFATRMPTGKAVVDVLVIAVVAALFFASQWISPRHPFTLRLTLFVALAVVSAGASWGLDPVWWVGIMLTAVASANLLPLVRDAVIGVIVMTALSAVLYGLELSTVWVVTGGVIAVLRGCLLIEIGRSKASRHAYALAAVENERLRFARDLHDLLGHSLVTMMAKAELAERLAMLDPDASAAAARDVREVGRAAMAQVQQAVTGYRSTSLAAELDQARRSLDPLPNGVRVSVPEREWKPEVDIVLAWGVREAVTNVLRHADASECAITVTENRRSVRLEVANDDRGGAVAETGRSGGHGLIGLRERAEAFGGALSAGPREGGGFLLAVELPLGAS